MVVRFIVSLCLFFSFCSKPEKVEKTIILAEDFDIPADKVYLTTMDKNALILDSAKVSKGSFRFSFSIEVDPFKACIAYLKSDGTYSIVYFKSNNPDLTDHSRSEFFMIEKGMTRLLGKKTEDKTSVYAFVLGGKENELIYAPGYDVLGYVDNTNSERYAQTIEAVKRSMKDYPHSYLLMEQVYVNRGNYKKQDLVDITTTFKEDVQRSAHGQNLNSYLEKLPEDYDPLKAFPLLNKSSNYITDYDRRKQLNMLILTTTWSHPANLLLFYMNLERQYFELEELSIVDIDVDEVARWWMDYKIAKGGDFIWEQLYVPPKKRELFLDLYDFPGFPLVVFTDQNGKEVKRFYNEEYRGLSYKYNPKYLQDMKAFIINYLKL